MYSEGGLKSHCRDTTDESVTIRGFCGTPGVANGTPVGVGLGTTVAVAVAVAVAVGVGLGLQVGCVVLAVFE